MKIKKPRISILISLLLIAILVHFYAGWIPVLFWHLTHKNPVTFHSVRIRVPITWIVFENKDADSISLVRKDRKVLIYISTKVIERLDQNHVSEQDIELLKERFAKWNAEFLGYGVLKVDNRTGNFIDLVKENKTLREITFPDEHIQITIFSSDPIQEDELKLLDDISFEQK